MTENTKPLILVVDDEPAITHLVGSILVQEGYETITARDGEEALILAEKRRPALAIVDVVLPAMEGWDVCQRLKHLFAPKKIPVIMLTCKTGEINEVRSFECGADAYFSKPADFPSLLKTIAGLLKIPSKH